MSFARGVGMFANRLMGEVDGGIKNIPPAPKPRSRRQLRLGDSFQRLKAEKEKEAAKAAKSQYAGLTDRQKALAKDRQGQIADRLDKAKEGPLQPETAFAKKSRSIRDLEQRPYGAKKLETTKAPSETEQLVENPETHHILELEFMDNIYRNASPRAKQKLDDKLANYITYAGETPYKLQGGDTKANYAVLSKLLHNSGKKGQEGIHQFLKKRGIKLSKYSLPDNATDDQRMQMLDKLLTDLAKAGYFDEIINRKFSPGKFETDDTAKMKTPQGLSFYSMMP
jgi:hypothetical protein